MTFRWKVGPVGSATTNASGKAILLVANPLAYHVETSHAIIASFAGAGSYKPSSGIATLTVNKADTLIKAGAFSGGAGDKKSLTAVLRRKTDTLPISAQTLTFKIDGNTLGTGITDGTGKATLLYKIDEKYSVGAHVLTAEFAGDNDHSLSTGTGTLTITKSETKTVANAVAGKIGDTKNLSATLKRKSDSAALTLKTLTFKVNGTSVGTANTDANGKATLSYKIDESLGTGAQSITVEYAGGDFYNASSGTATLTVSKADSAVSVASVSPRYIGDTKSLTATLTRKSDKLALSGRTLTFKIDGTSIGSAITDANGKATLSYKIDESFGLGAHSLTVEFSGDANYNSSAGSTTLTIKQTPTKLIIIGSVSGKVGSTVYLKAKLLRSSDNAPLEGKTVRFQIDGADVGAGVTDGSGLAVLAYVIPITLSVGAHTITVIFDGDALYLSSSNSGATLTVK